MSMSESNSDKDDDQDDIQSNAERALTTIRKSRTIGWRKSSQSTLPGHRKSVSAIAAIKERKLSANNDSTAASTSTATEQSADARNFSNAESTPLLSELPSEARYNVTDVVSALEAIQSAVATRNINTRRPHLPILARSHARRTSSTEDAGSSERSSPLSSDDEDDKALEREEEPHGRDTTKKDDHGKERQIVGPRNRSQYFARKPTVIARKPSMHITVGEAALGISQPVPLGAPDDANEDDESVAMVLDPNAVDASSAATSTDSSSTDSNPVAPAVDRLNLHSNISKRMVSTSVLSPRDLFTVHLSEDEKRTIVYKADTPLRNVLERICFARNWNLANCIVTTMDGIRIKGILSPAVTLGVLPLGSRHVRMTQHVETAEEKRDKLRQMYKASEKAEGFLEHTQSAPTFVQKEVVEFKPALPVAPDLLSAEEEAARKRQALDPSQIFSVFMGETMKTIVYRPEAILGEELMKICRARDWHLEERVVLTLKGKLIEEIAVPLSTIKRRAVQFLSRDEVRPVVNYTSKRYVGRERSPSPPPAELPELSPRLARVRMTWKQEHILATEDNSVSPLQTPKSPTQTPTGQPRLSSSGSKKVMARSVSVVTHPHTNLVAVESELSLATILSEPRICDLAEVRDLFAEHYQKLSPSERMVWVGEHSHGEHFFVVASLRRTTQGYSVLRHTKSGQEELIVPHDALAKGKAELHRKLRQWLQERWQCSLARVKDATLAREMSEFESQPILRQEFDALRISVVLCRAEQTNPLEMFQNEPSPAFRRFVRRVLGVGSGALRHTVETSWQHRRVLLYLAPYMDEEQHRRFIGNITAVILFHDHDKRYDNDDTEVDVDADDDADSAATTANERSDSSSLSQTPLGNGDSPSPDKHSPSLSKSATRFARKLKPLLPSFDPTEMQALGVVPQAFTVVREHEATFEDSERYRVGVFNKNTLRAYGPPVPALYAFDRHELRNFLFIKHYNGMMNTRVSPPISRLYETPRLHAIEALVTRFLHKGNERGTGASGGAAGAPGRELSSPELLPSTPLSESPKERKIRTHVKAGSLTPQDLSQSLTAPMSQSSPATTSSFNSHKTLTPVKGQ